VEIKQIKLAGHAGAMAPFFQSQIILACPLLIQHFNKKKFKREQFILIKTF